MRLLNLKKRTKFLWLLGGLAGACGQPTGTDPLEDPAVEGERRVFLKSYAEKVVLPLYAEAERLAEDLEDALHEHEQALSDDSLRTAQAAWVALIRVWQRAELMQVGPAAPAQFYPESGEDLRDAIYSWPFTNPCRVDQQLTDAAYEDTDALRGAGPNTYGLDALEYLLFHEGDSNACSSLAAINEEGSWDALVADDELVGRRAAYAVAVGQLLTEDLTRLLGRWSDDADAYVEQLSEAGESGLYATARAGVNAVTDGLFYIETEATELKLAVPAGISDVCTDDVCPEARESLYADISVPHLRANVEGFRDVYLGPGGKQGLDALLVSAGEKELTVEMRSRIDHALEALDDIDDPTMAVALAEDPKRVRDAHGAFQDLVSLFKDELVRALALSIPDRAAGDND